MELSLGERQAFLGRYFRELEDWRDRDLRMIGEVQPSDVDIARFERQSQRLSRWRKAYEDSLPKVIMARCPFTQDLFVHSYDPFGLDGLWWNYDAPARPFEKLPPTYLALTGAVSLQAQVEKAPFLCKPGPAVPYLLPRLLQTSGVQAVVRELSVGPHRAFAVVYFARPLPGDLSPPNEWGTNRAYLDQGSSQGWVSNPEDLEVLDFDLRPWLERGLLYWMVADSSDQTLRNSVADCPYLDLPGERKLQRIENGRVWTE